MPELPEVETIRRTLTPKIEGRDITGLEVIRPALIRHPDPAAFRAGVVGSRVGGTSRRGKYLILHLVDPETGTPRYDLVIHLMMAGRLLFCSGGLVPGDPKTVEKTHVVLRLGEDHLRYVDFRHLGRLFLVPPGDYRAVPGLRRLGREVALEGRAAGDCLDLEGFLEALGRRRGRLKPLLLDQAFLAGVGNIYADEALFRAGLHPTRTAASLDREERLRLYEALRRVLAEAIEDRGTTFSRYVDAEGQTGSYRRRLRVYGREGEPCFRCGHPVQRLVLAGRSAHFCPVCQPEGGRAAGPRRG